MFFDFFGCAFCFFLVFAFVWSFLLSPSYSLTVTNRFDFLWTNFKLSFPGDGERSSTLVQIFSWRYILPGLNSRPHFSQVTSLASLICCMLFGFSKFERENCIGFGRPDYLRFIPNYAVSQTATDDLARDLAIFSTIKMSYMNSLDLKFSALI